MLALNLSTQMFEAIKLDDAVNKYKEFYLFMWKFDKKPLFIESSEWIEQENEYNISKEEASTKLDNIFYILIENLDELLAF